MTPVLDASALLAYLHRERGWEAVRKVATRFALMRKAWVENGNLQTPIHKLTAQANQKRYAVHIPYPASFFAARDRA